MQPEVYSEERSGPYNLRKNPNSTVRVKEKHKNKTNHPMSVLSKFVGPVGQPDISYECPTKNVRVSDQMSDRKYKNIHLVEEKKRNTSNHKG